jgi:hypothetical protein
MEDKILEGCEHQWAITQLEWHHEKFIRTGLHSYLFNVLVHYVDLIIPQLEINSAKVFSPLNQSNKASM